MNIAICDDEQQDIDILYNYCKSCKLPYNISTFLSASDLLEAFKSQFYDLIFLDIEMDKPNGFEIGSILAGYSPRPVIVFTTNALQYAVRGYGIAFRFLCKPITITMFQSVVREALDEILPQKAAVTCGSTQKMISINDVIYFESLNRHIIFHFANTSTLEIKDSMENMISFFSYPSFVQIHRSYCINLNYVDSFTPLAVTMTDGCKIPLSRKKQTIFQERFNNLMYHQMNFPIEVYTIIIECLLIFYFFHKEVRPVYPSRRYIILFCISLFAVIMLSTLYTPMFIRLVIISLFLFLCYTFCFKCKIFQITYTIILFFVTSMFSDVIGAFVLSRLGISINELLGISEGRRQT